MNNYNNFGIISNSFGSIPEAFLIEEIANSQDNRLLKTEEDYDLNSVKKLEIDLTNKLKRGEY